MANKSLIATYEELDKNVKLILQVLFGWCIGGIYRILRYLETKNITTLVVGILALVTPISVVFWVLDLISEYKNNKITLLVD